MREVNPPVATNKRLNANHFFKEPIKFDGYYFVPSGKPGMGYEYDEKFVVSRKRLAWSGGTLDSAGDHDYSDGTLIKITS